MLTIINTIITEMYNGNFSFLILVVGLLQLVVMIRNGRKSKIKKEDNFKKQFSGGNVK